MSELVPEVLSEVKEILLEWERVTAQLRQTLAEGRIEQLASLLDRRQQLADRLDALKREHELGNWSGVRREVGIAEILNRLIVSEREIGQEMERKLHTLQEGILRVQRQRTADLAYRRRRPQRNGAFLDTKR